GSACQTHSQGGKKMSPEITGIVSIVVLLLLIFLRMPIGFAMALVGFAGFAYLGSIKGALRVIGMEPFATASNYMWGALALFILMGQFAFRAGIVERLYNTIYKWLGHLPGGLAIATIGACGGFSAVSASSLATAATMGAVALPEMKKYNYDPGLATGCIAAGGTLGILIPPSGIFIMYGILTETSISQLFLAGILPGILLTSLFIATILLQVLRKPNLAPSGPNVPIREKLGSVPGILDMAALIILVLGGLWGGFFTPNEAGAVGAAGALLIGLVRKKFTVKKFLDSISGSMRTTAMILVIVIGAMIYNRFLAVSMLPMWLASFVQDLPLPTVLITISILVIYALLGCVFDSGAIVLLTVPIFFPVIVALDINPIWFGVALTIMAEMGLITPPVGMNVYIIAGIATDVPMSTVFRGVLPFVIPMIVCLALLLIFPQIVLVLVNLLY
ncbi:MAG: TRAP transporter large permease, partial [Dehalococcoidales bacterium]|nr:TRAP transporter large permease [Dehalococcoidales bacterium]